MKKFIVTRQVIYHDEAIVFAINEQDAIDQFKQMPMDNKTFLDTDYYQAKETDDNYGEGTYEWIKESSEFFPGGGVCYVPECGDTQYTYDDYMRIANGNEQLAGILFQQSDWQHPETILEELIREGEVVESKSGDLHVLKHF